MGEPGAGSFFWCLASVQPLRSRTVEVPPHYMADLAILPASNLRLLLKVQSMLSVTHSRESFVLRLKLSVDVGLLVLTGHQDGIQI